MKVYTARQAILNRKENVVAYELLYRGGPENVFPNIDPHKATSKLVMRTHLSQWSKVVSKVGHPYFFE